MKNLVMLTILLFSSCMTIGNYSRNRINDLTDILKVGVEKKVFGVSLTLDAYLFGFKNEVSGLGYGQRFGHFGFYRTGKNIPVRIYKDNKIVAYYGDIYFSWYSAMLYEPIGLTYNRNSKKLVRFTLPAVISRKGKSPFPYNKQNQSRESYCVLPIEFSIGAYYGFRVGFNPHEFLDFILGIVGIDILNDGITQISN